MKRKITLLVFSILIFNYLNAQSDLLLNLKSSSQVINSFDIELSDGVYIFENFEFRVYFQIEGFWTISTIQIANLSSNEVSKGNGNLMKHGEISWYQFQLDDGKSGSFEILPETKQLKLELSIVEDLDSDENSEEFSIEESALAYECTDKQELLSSLIGEHKLTSISATMGVNTMEDYYYEDGIWVASGSANEGGTREGYTIDITQEEKVKLNSMKIIVNQDLSVSFSCNNQIIFSAPYKKDGMSYFLQNSPETFWQIPSSLQQSSTFIEDYLYIYVKDKIPFESMGFVEPFISGVDAYLLCFSCSSGQFELKFFSELENDAILKFE